MFNIKKDWVVVLRKVVCLFLIMAITIALISCSSAHGEPAIEGDLEKLISKGNSMANLKNLDIVAGTDEQVFYFNKSGDLDPGLFKTTFDGEDSTKISNKT